MKEAAHSVVGEVTQDIPKIGVGKPKFHALPVIQRMELNFSHSPQMHYVPR